MTQDVHKRLHDFLRNSNRGKLQILGGLRNARAGFGYQSLPGVSHNLQRQGAGG